MDENSAAFREQLNGLVDLLHAVGIHNVSTGDVKSGARALKNQGIGAPIVFPTDVPESKELNDDQIEAMILKLQQAQAQAPQLMEALEDYVEQKNGTSLAGKAAIKKRAKKKNGNKQNGQVKEQYAFIQAYQPQNQPQQHGQLQPNHQQQQADHDDYDEEEEDDDFDEDADYPMVGPGVSDDDSVVSDMTTPTVVSSINIHAEEHYKDQDDMVVSPYGPRGGPPLRIGQPKKKNLVSSRPIPGVPMRIGPPIAVGPGAGGLTSSQHSAKGAAAKRRQTYQQTMSRLQQNPNGTTMAGPKSNPRALRAAGAGAGTGAGAGAGAVGDASGPVLSGDHNTEDLFASGGSSEHSQQPRGQLPQRSTSGNMDKRERPRAPPRTKSAGANRMKQQQEKGDEQIGNGSYHGGPGAAAAAATADNNNNWMEFDGDNNDNSRAKKTASSNGGKPKKKGVKKTSGGSGAAPRGAGKQQQQQQQQQQPLSPKSKKKANTSIDRDGFLVGGPGSPTKNRASSDGSSMNKMKKKAVKKRAGKRPPGEAGKTPSSGGGKASTGGNRRPAS